MDKALIGTGSTGVLLEVPFFQPIYDGLSSNEVPFSIKLNNPDTNVFKFNLPNNGEKNYIITGWYAILAKRVEVAPNQFRLIFIEPDTQLYTQDESLASVPNLIYGYQAGNLFQFSWQLGDINFGSYHFAHKHYHWRRFPIAQAMPAGVQGQLSLLFSRDNTKWLEFLYGQNLYLFVGLIGKRELTVPPPFNIDSSLMPVRNLGYSLHCLKTQNSNSVGSLSVSNRQNIKLTNRHPTIIDELVFTGEIDGIYVKSDWYNGNICDTWLPAILFEYLRSGGIMPCPIFVSGNCFINFDLAQGIRQNGDNQAIFSIDIAGGCYGF